jgi:enoyl-CoA hydratase/carnithine racemase
MSDTVTLHIENHIARVTLNRPDKKNALTVEMLAALVDMGKQIANDASVRVVILSGAGGCFCAGLDLSVLMSFAQKVDDVKDALATQDETGATVFQRPATIWRDIPQPVIAVVDGVAFGGGIQIALGADFRVAAPSAKLSIREAQWGIIPDMGITQTLSPLMRADQAKRLIMTGESIGAERAADMGLITEIADDPHAAADALAAALLQRSPQVVRASKQLVDQGWSGGPDALRLEASLQSEIIGTKNQLEAAFANMQKRAPNYED